MCTFLLQYTVQARVRARHGTYTPRRARSRRPPGAARNSRPIALNSREEQTMENS